MKAKNVVIVLAATGLISTQAYAVDAGIKGRTVDQNQAEFTEADASRMFEKTSKPMQVATLSSTEMKDTQGAWGPAGAVIGGLGALGGYTLDSMISGSRWSPGAAAAYTASGAAAGAVAGPVGAIWGFNAAIGAGTAAGVANATGY